MIASASRSATTVRACRPSACSSCGRVSTLRSQVGFGLRTVYRRLRLLYGEQCSMELESEPGAGTTVTLRFPIRKEAGA